MNAERLHAIALEIQKDLNASNAPALLTQLAQALRQLAQSPGDSSHQQQVAESRDRLDEALAGALSNDFSPAWRQAITELGVDDLLGESLRETVQAIFDRHELTASAAADEMEHLKERIETLATNVAQLIAAFQWFKIGSEELDAGQFELGILIPRNEVSNELGELGQEFLDLRKILSPFVELASGSRPDFQVRSISSSDFQVFLDSTGATAAGLAYAIARLVKVYKDLLDIRVARKLLKDAKVPDEAFESVTEHADQRMESEIRDLVEEILNEFGAQRPPERQNELRVDLKVSLKGLAKRIDHGYHIEVRAGPEPEDDDSEGESPEAKAHREAVTSRREALGFISPEGSPILGLEEPKEGPEV